MFQIGPSPLPICGFLSLVLLPDELVKVVVVAGLLDEAQLVVETISWGRRCHPQLLESHQPESGTR